MNTEHKLDEVPEDFNDWREARRFRAWELHEKGWSQVQIAEASGVTEGAVSQWFKAVREEGLEALRSSTGQRGPTLQLSEEERWQLPDLLARGAEAYGFRGDVWTRARVAKVIEKEFGVSYSVRHVGRILAEINWTRQKPVERADQRDEDKIAQWEAETFPELKKKAAREDRTLVFVDEAGFYLLPAAVRTYAPCGETPVLRYPYWDHLSVISAITPDGKLYTMTQEKAFRGPAIRSFLGSTQICGVKSATTAFHENL